LRLRIQYLDLNYNRELNQLC